MGHFSPILTSGCIYVGEARSCFARHSREVTAKIMNSLSEKSRLIKKRGLLAILIMLAATALFVGAFSARDVVAPLHWAALWLLVIGFYVAAALAIKPEISIRFLGPLFPILLIALLEFGWTVYDYSAQKSQGKSSAETIPPGAKLQSVVDFDYQPLTHKMEFIPDSIRLLKLPSNFRSASVNTNTLGYRGGEFGVKRAGVFRIIMMGDSGLFGWNAPNDASTIPVRLERILNKHLGDLAEFEVLNLGVPSGISNFHVPVFATYGQELDPDFLIMFLGLNDLGGSNVAMPRSFSQRLKKYLSLHTFASQLTHLATEFLGTLHLLAQRLRSYAAISQALFPPEKSWVGDNVETVGGHTSNFEAYAAVYLNNLERIYRLARKLDIGFATVEQPSMRLGLSRGKNLSNLDMERKKSFMEKAPISWREGTEMYDDFIVQGNKRAVSYGGVHIGLSDVLAAHDGPMIQGRYVGQPKNAIFVTDAHYTGYGLDLLARGIFDKLEGRLRQRLASP